MGTCGESSSGLPNIMEGDKPVIVRVKRKANQLPLDAFWLEINERPMKRASLGLENLSLSDSARKDELKTRKLFVHHVETTTTTTLEILQSFVPRSSDGSESKSKTEERRQLFKNKNVRKELLLKARETKEELMRNARFEQIWRRRGNREALNDTGQMYDFYDVVRVDGEDKMNELPQEEELSVEDRRLLSSYLPMLREFIPSAAEDIESDLVAHMSKQGAKDDFVYDFYTVNEDADVGHEDISSRFPLVQVEDEDFYDGPDDSEYETDDSNAENNPLNDYPDEMSDEEEEENENDSSSNGESEEERETASDESSDSEGFAQYGSSEGMDPLSDEYGVYEEEDGENEYCQEDDQDWRWRHR